MGVIVNNCCCGCSLQTGTQIIGWLGLVGGLISVIMRVVKMNQPQEIPQQDIFYISEIVISVIWIVVSIPILIAASKNRGPGLLLPWLILIVLAILYMLGYGLYHSIVIVFPFFGVGWGIGYIFIIIFVCALGIYYWLVIYSYRQELKEQLPLLPGGKVN